jgi:hypothetical protein
MNAAQLGPAPLEPQCPIVQIGRPCASLRAQIGTEHISVDNAHRKINAIIDTKIGHGVVQLARRNCQM